MEFIIFGIILLLMFRLMLSTTKPKVEFCKKHTWTYDKNEHLYCSTCGFRSGNHKTDNGDY